jgi:hypothetical protein
MEIVVNFATSKYCMCRVFSSCNIGQVWWFMSVIQITNEIEAGGF